MKTLFSALALGAGLLTVGRLPTAAKTPTSLKIYSAVEVEFPTEVGKAYQLQGAVNLTNWTDIGNIVLGHGRSVSQVFSSKSTSAVDFAAYRLQILNGPTNGFAPWSLAGARLQMDDSSTHYVEYAAEAAGSDHYGDAKDPFTYQYTRLSENLARVDRNFSTDRSESLTYAYSEPGRGTWVRDEFRQGSFERRVLGVFRYLADTTNQIPGVPIPPVLITALQPPAPPNVLTGLVYHVLSGTRPDELHFQTAAGGVEQPSPALSGVEGEVEVSPGGNAFSYTYKVLGTNTASLIINFGYYGFGGDKNEYDLTYTDGPAGTFTRRIYRLGALYSTDTGAFSPFVQPPANPGGTGGTPPSTHAPPANPVGLTYTIHDDTVPPRLVFQSTGAGIEFDDSAPDVFTFTYGVRSATAFGLRVQFKADRWDEYDLTFVRGNHGTFVRRQFKKGVLSRTSAGAFTVAVTGP